jgi:malate dehydrogenase (oxaloacetate-decarboxylating)(NADP+)
LRFATIRRRRGNYTARGNLVAVVSNGTAVLGLGNIGPLASKPVMEGKAVLFKKFAGIDVFDIEIDEPDVDRKRDRRRAGTDLRRHQSRGHQGARMLRGRTALRERMDIPVFHDDQHGTAIIVAAGILNGLELAGKKIETPRSSPPAPVLRRWPASTCW